jgi:quinol monooxygenase YgiN/catechol 2,3-dioxygenase-like lactoylglutathione lyase family enzyme
MENHINQITLVVKDYDEAIAFYTQKLYFDLIEDTVLSETKRWVVVAPKNSQCRLLLAKAANEEQLKSVGNQTGGRIFLFLNTDNLERERQNLIDNKVKIVRESKQENYGKVLVFEDLYGNLWDLIEPIVKSNSHYFSTAILAIKPEVDFDTAIKALKKLQVETKLESGNFLFELHSNTTDAKQIIVWEGFYSESDFQLHLQSNHLQDFLKQNVVDFVSGYPSKRIV